MNAAPQYVTTAVMVISGLFTYHVLASSTPTEELALTTADTSDLESRLASLESRIDHGPLLKPMSDSGDLAGRVRDLEKRLGALATGESSVSESQEVTPKGDAAPNAVEDLVATEEGKGRLDKIVDGAVKRNRESRTADRIDSALSRLGIELDADQRKQFDEAFVAYRTELREVRSSARAEGLSRSDARSSMQEVNTKFTTNLGKFLPVGDAESVARSVGQLGGRRGR